MSNASRFKLHDVLGSECCALSCDAPAATEFACPVPLCELHMLRVYKAVNRHLKQVQADEQNYQLFAKAENHIVGPCPACGVTGYLERTDTDVIHCRNESCRYSAELVQFERVRRRAMFNLAGRKSVVYYIGFRDLIKIGTTTNLQRRWEMIPATESLLGFEYGDRTQEAKRHEQFRFHRYTGEWFTNNAELRAHINKVSVIA